MHIVQIGSEIAPFAKVGGLGDVMMGLSIALSEQGHDVDIFVPKYDCFVGVKKWSPFKKSVPSFFKGTWHTNHLYKTALTDSLDITAFESTSPENFFNRGVIYGCPDDVDRFLYFSRASLDYLMAHKKVPDILHIHDWQAAVIAVLIREPEFRDHFKKTKVLLTIHNMEYQGWCSDHNLDAIGMKGPYDQLKTPFSKDINLLKGGILSADAVTTVSATYAQEVLTKEGGKGLEGAIAEIGDRFSGIVNGLDYDYWNPETDPFLTSHYSMKSLSGKAKMKKKVQEELGLETASGQPLLATVCRLVPQKGVALIRYALEKAEQFGVQCVVLGTAPDPKIHAEFLELQKKYEASRHVRIVLKNEEAFAHRLYAAADLFFVPSIFEPCGLTQMIALRYGALPVVRKTGGLADTVFDLKNGFVFETADFGGVDYALIRAVELYTKNQAAFHHLQKCGMQMDYSWKRPSDLYLALYKHILLS